MDLYNINTEADLLGNIINTPDKLCDVVDVLTYNDFYNKRHQILYRLMVDMFGAGKVIDIVTVAESLKSNLQLIGGMTYLSSLSGSCLPTSNIRAYADIIKEKSKKRVLEKAAQQILKDLKSEDNSSDDLIGTLQNKLYDLSTNDSEDDGTLDKPLQNFIGELERRKKQGGGITGIPTGYFKLDKAINGLNRHDYLVICGRPSMGKTTLAVNIGVNVALQQKKNVAIFSLEMNKTQLFEKITAMMCKIELDKIKKGDLNINEWNQVSRATEKLLKSNLNIYEDVLSFNRMKAQCKKLKIQKGLDVVVVDYIGLMESNSKAENRQQEISQLSRKIKLMAKELDLTMVILSQLSRSPEARADHRPMLSDLRESGSIEQDADIVLGMYRDEYYNAESEDKGIVESIILKNRSGIVGVCRQAWLPQYQLIGELDYIYAGKCEPERIFKK